MTSLYKTMTGCAVALVLGATMQAQAQVQAQSAAAMEFHIESRSLKRALTQFGEQTGVQILFSKETVGDLQTDGVVGTYTPEAALQKLLAQSKLEYEFINPRTIAVRARGSAAGEPAAHAAMEAGTIRLAMATPGQDVSPAKDAKPSFWQRFRFAQSGENGGSGAERQAPAEGAIEEVLVTARKREERLIDVPMAVSNIGSAELESANIRSSTDLAGLVPGLYFAQNNISAQSSDFTYITMRGVGFNAGLEPAVGVYVDGVYQSSLGFNLDFLDAERIEVLRGPQGTLFGRNTEGGALNIVTAKPGRELQRSVLLEYGSFNSVRARGLIRGPVSDTVSAGISAEFRDTDGYLENRTLNKDQSPSKSYAVRPVVIWRPNDDLELNLTGDFYRRRYNEADIGVPAGCECYDTYSEYYVMDEQELYGGMFSARWELGDIALSSISGARRASTDIYLDNDGIASNLSQPFTNPFGETYAGTNWNMNSRQRTFSQEFRVESNGEGPLEWLAGLYYFDEQHEQHRFSYYNDTQTFTPTNAALLGNGAINETVVLDRDGFAVFGQASYKIGAFDLTAGLRYDREKVAISGLRRRYLVPVPLLQFNPAGSDTFKNVSPMGSVSYAVADNARVYATIARGWKAGGFPKFPSSPVALVPYDSESSTSYELGWKASYPSVGATVRAAVYYINIDDQQVTSLTRIDNINTSVINNAGASRSQGVELEASLQPLEGLNLSGAVSFADTEFTRYVDQNNFDHAGESFPYTPKWTGNVTAAYARPVSGEWSLALRGAYRYIGSTRVENVNRPASYLPVRSYDRVDASVGLENEMYKVTLFVENLLDSDDVTNVAANGFSQLTTGPYFNKPLSPRSVGVRFVAQF